MNFYVFLKGSGKGGPYNFFLFFEIIRARTPICEDLNLGCWVHSPSQVSKAHSGIFMLDVLHFTCAVDVFFSSRCAVDVKKLFN